MTIAIATMFNQGYQDLADITHYQNKVPYAELHGYPVFAMTEDFATDININFNKMSFILDIFKKRPDVEWVYWLDCDAMITNWTRKLEEFVSDEHHFVVCLDRYNINAGSFFIRNSDQGRAYFQMIWDRREEFNKFEWAEQQCMIDTIEQYADIVKLCPQRTFNSFDYDFYHRDHGNTHDWDLFGENGNWQPGDFVIHWPGVKYETRLELAHEKLTQVVK